MKKSNKYLPLVLLATLFLTSCYYDKEDVLYRFSQSNANCDTSIVTYALSVAPIMQSYCNTCHSTASPSGGWATDTHAGLSVIALNGKLYGAVSHSIGFSAMPKGGNSLSTCDISKIKIWIGAGALNN